MYMYTGVLATSSVIISVVLFPDIYFQHKIFIAYINQLLTVNVHIVQQYGKSDLEGFVFKISSYFECVYFTHFQNIIFVKTFQ